MKTNELRIGNYLNGKRGHVVVTEIRANNSVKIHDNTSSFYVGICLIPIEITKEWLLKLGFEHNDYSELEEHKQFAAQLKECYDYAKQGRKALHDKLDKAYNNVAKEGDYKVVYKEVNEIESVIEMYDTKVCEWVIKNRKMFWV